jgi:fatty-acyl-CoA synthase
VGRADLAVRRHGDGGTELRLCGPRPPARPRRRGIDGPVDAAVRAQRRRARSTPAAVTAFTTAGARFGLRRRQCLCRTGWPRRRWACRSQPIDTGLQVDEIDAVELEEHRRAVPAGDGPARRFPLLGPPLPGIEIRVVGDGGAVLGERQVGVLQLRGESVTPGYLTVAGPVATQDSDGWLDTGDEGYLTDGAVVVCGRARM